jgi:hypothetical protein
MAHGDARSAERAARSGDDRSAWAELDPSPPPAANSQQAAKVSCVKGEDDRTLPTGGVRQAATTACAGIASKRGLAPSHELPVPRKTGCGEVPVPVLRRSRARASWWAGIAFLLALWMAAMLDDRRNSHLDAPRQGRPRLDHVCQVVDARVGSDFVR